MKQTDNDINTYLNPKTIMQKAKLPYLLIAVFSALVLFGLGFGIGSGRLTVGNLKKNAQTSSSSSKLDFSEVEEVYNTLNDEFDGTLDNEKAIEGIKQGLANATGDQYTEYFNPEGAKEFQDSLQGEFTGIGAELGKEEKNIVVIAPIAGFPADKAGILPKDVIVEIDGKPVFDITTSEAVKLIRGPKDTSVKLRVIRDGKEDLTFDIVRDTIKTPSVEWNVREDGIGYIKISRFSEDTADLSRKAAAEFSSKKVKGIVLDLRNDPGGELGSSIEVASLWIPEGKTVLLEKRGGKTIKDYKAQGGNVLSGIPTVALINGGSASASEILAGALRDQNQATLLGEKSYGKGSVQRIIQLKDGGLLKVTIARWFTPNDKNIDKEGLEPDTKVERSVEDIKAKRDPQLDAAIQKLSK